MREEGWREKKEKKDCGNDNGDEDEENGGMESEKGDEDGDDCKKQEHEEDVSDLRNVENENGQEFVKRHAKWACFERYAGVKLRLQMSRRRYEGNEASESIDQ